MGTRQPLRYDGRRQAWPDERPSLAEVLVYVAASAGALVFLFLVSGWLQAAVLP